MTNTNCMDITRYTLLESCFICANHLNKYQFNLILIKERQRIPLLKKLFIYFHLTYTWYCYWLQDIDLCQKITNTSIINVLINNKFSIINEHKCISYVIFYGVIVSMYICYSLYTKSVIIYTDCCHFSHYKPNLT